MTASAYAIAPRSVEGASSRPLSLAVDATAADDLRRAARYAAAAKSAGTIRAYRLDWADFQHYCRANGLESLPASPQTVAAYSASAIDRLKISTLRRRLVAISQMHKKSGLESPTAHEALREALRGIARDEAVQQRSKRAKKAAMTTEVLTQALACLDRSTIAGKRDAAILLLGFSAALRRSELAALNLEDLEFDDRGVVVTIRRSKTDQEGTGSRIDVPTIKNPGLCPARALETWIGAGAIVAGPLFRSFGLDGRLKANRIDGRDVARLIKRVTSRAGMDGDFSGHSLRRGYVTTGIRRGIAAAALMQRTRHKSLAVFQGYVDDARLFVDNPLQAILT